MKKTVFNTTNMPIYVGACMIPAGDSREFEESDIPAHLLPQDDKPKEEAAPPADPIAELQAKPIKDIKAALENLDDVSLTKLEELEKAAETPRSSLVELIGAEQLKRAGK